MVDPGFLVDTLVNLFDTYVHAILSFVAMLTSDRNVAQPLLTTLIAATTLAVPIAIVSGLAFGVFWAQVVKLRDRLVSRPEGILGKTREGDRPSAFDDQRGARGLFLFYLTCCRCMPCRCARAAASFACKLNRWGWCLRCGPCRGLPDPNSPAAVSAAAAAAAAAASPAPTSPAPSYLRSWCGWLCCTCCRRSNGAGRTFVLKVRLRGEADWRRLSRRGPFETSREFFDEAAEKLLPPESRGRSKGLSAWLLPDTRLEDDGDFASLAGDGKEEIEIEFKE